MKVKKVRNQVKNTCKNVKDSHWRVLVKGDKRNDKQREYSNQLYNINKKRGPMWEGSIAECVKLISMRKVKKKWW